MGGSSMSVVFMVLVFGGMGVYYFVVYRKHASPEARAKAFAAAGFRQGEGVQMSYTGQILARDAGGSFMESVMAIERREVYPTMLSANLTTHDRLHIAVGGQNHMFEGPMRPRLRIVGRIMLRDATGVADMVLWNQTKTMVYFVDEGQPIPPGANRKCIYNQVGAQEPSCVVEIALPNAPPVYAEIVESGAIALMHWTQAVPPAPGQFVQTPYTPVQSVQPAGYPPPNVQYRR